ncbi:hypothetical protein [Natrinema salifodinae]|nr:hypothetical protein [Natrinema salifodinae]
MERSGTWVVRKCRDCDRVTIVRASASGTEASAIGSSRECPCGSTSLLEF